MTPRLEQLLRADPHIVHVEKAESWKIPQISPDLFYPDERQDATCSIELIKAYLVLPYVIGVVQFLVMLFF